MPEGVQAIFRVARLVHHASGDHDRLKAEQHILMVLDLPGGGGENKAASSGGRNRAEQHPILIHPSGSPSLPRSIHDKLPIAISESRKAAPKFTTLSGECGLICRLPQCW